MISDTNKNTTEHQCDAITYNGMPLFEKKQNLRKECRVCAYNYCRRGTEVCALYQVHKLRLVHCWTTCTGTSFFTNMLCVIVRCTTPNLLLYEVCVLILLTTNILDAAYTYQTRSTNFILNSVLFSKGPLGELFKTY